MRAGAAAYGWDVRLTGVAHDAEIETGPEEGGHEKTTFFHR